ncbi:MAG: DUF1801 domain-containing protein [Bacteroidota bacterium]
MQSKAKTVAEYIDSLPADRKKVIVAMRKAVKQNLPKGFEEVMSYGMIGYVVPHRLYPKGYHVTPELPLPFINIASQKNHIAFYHMTISEGPLAEWFKEEWKEHSTKKLDMGKSCVRFKNPDDVPVELLGIVASKVTPQQWIEQYEKSLTKAKNKKA